MELEKPAGWSRDAAPASGFRLARALPHAPNQPARHQDVTEGTGLLMATPLLGAGILAPPRGPEEAGSTVWHLDTVKKVLAAEMIAP